MQTASFTTPSPNKIANNLGSVTSFTKVKAAIVSVAEMTEANIRISFNDKLMRLPEYSENNSK